MVVIHNRLAAIGRGIEQGRAVTEDAECPNAFRVFFFRALVLTQCGTPFVTRCPISMIRPNRSSGFIDWCEISPFLLSSSRMSSTILFSVSVSDRSEL